MPDHTMKKWPSYMTAPEAHIHAIGTVALMYNELEQLFDLFLYHYMGTDHEIQAYVFSALNLHSQTELLQLCLQSKVSDPDALEHLKHFIKCFGLCAGNRNILMHAKLNPHKTTEQVIALEKKSRRKPHLVNDLAYQLKEIRGAADEMFAAWFYGAKLMLTLRAQEEHNAPAGPRPPPSWPDTPPLPTRLIPQNPSNRKKQ